MSDRHLELKKAHAKCLLCLPSLFFPICTSSDGTLPTAARAGSLGFRLFFLPTPHLIHQQLLKIDLQNTQHQTLLSFSTPPPCGSFSPVLTNGSPSFLPGSPTTLDSGQNDLSKARAEHILLQTLCWLPLQWKEKAPSSPVGPALRTHSPCDTSLQGPATLYLCSCRTG